MKIINELAKEIHSCSKNNGCWDRERTFGEILVECYSDLSDAFKLYKNGEPAFNLTMTCYSKL